jgi:hypothetical protein
MSEKPRLHRSDINAVNMLILDIQALESRAHRLGMHLAAKALNESVNKAGWELAEQIERMKAFAS